MVIAGNNEEIEQLRAENARLRLRIEMYAWKRRNWKAGRYCRYGFRRDPDRPGILVGHPPEIDIIREVLRLHNQGMTPYAISAELNAKKYPHRSAKFARSLVENIIRRAKDGEYGDVAAVEASR